MIRGYKAEGLVNNLRSDFRRSNNLNMFMFANNRDFGKMFTGKHKRVWVVFDEQVEQLWELFQLREHKQIWLHAYA